MICDSNLFINLRQENILRREKLKIFEKIDLYPNFFKKVNNISDIYFIFDKLNFCKICFEDIFFIFSGRIVNKRFFGKSFFINLQDFSGKIQLYIKKENLSIDVYNSFLLFDIGDIVWVYGFLFFTNIGSISLKVLDIRLLVKSLISFPSKWKGLKNKELCYRNRYLDLIVNKKTKECFINRIKLIQFIRNFFLNLGFFEVETPMMHNIPGGASARPFKTYHNTLGINLYLRIAPELYLKKLIIGGFEKIFEINRSFRNEGLSTRHNSEFTMIEFYQAYIDYKDLMELTEILIKNLFKFLLGNIDFFENIDLNSRFDCITLFNSILKYNIDFESDVISNIDLLRNKLNLLNISWDNSWSLEKLQVVLFESTVEIKLKKPTFIIDYPTEISPLSKISNINCKKADRFEFFINGFEIANGFSELNDSILQSKKFKEQIIDSEINFDSIYYDDDYIRALEYGLPPTAGEGIGIDRLTMIFTKSLSIKDVIFFPLMKN
ncbi:MAG TPA: lysine--tRNA ligase [Candidatus Azosocius sp. HAIN]